MVKSSRKKRKSLRGGNTKATLSLDDDDTTGNVCFEIPVERAATLALDSHPAVSGTATASVALAAAQEAWEREKKEREKKEREKKEREEAAARDDVAAIEKGSKVQLKDDEGEELPEDLLDDLSLGVVYTVLNIEGETADIRYPGGNTYSDIPLKYLKPANGGGGGYKLSLIHI